MPWELTGNANTIPGTNFLGTTDGQPLVIQPTGNVGVGTPSPGQLLDVVGTSPILRARTSTSQGAWIGLETLGDGTNDVAIVSNWVTGPSNLYFMLGQTEGTQMTITNTGNVGIGTVGPEHRLQISQDGEFGFDASDASPNAGYIRFGDNTGWKLHFARSREEAASVGGTLNTGTTGTLMTIQDNGNVGIGTVAPGSNLHIHVPASGNAISAFALDVESFVSSTNANASYFVQVRDIQAAPPNGFTHFCIQGNGNVGIGTASPTAKLEVDGDVKVTGDVLLTGADCAEEFDVAETGDIEPGTVMVLDQDGALHQSQQAYDKRVAGVVSGAGDYKPGLILDRRQSRNNRVPVALVGKVYCKVDAQYAPIEIGDLLTTSPTLGHAMKANDPLKAFGSVIGKALRPLEVGQGMIPVLIALQ